MYKSILWNCVVVNSYSSGCYRYIKVFSKENGYIIFKVLPKIFKPHHKNKLSLGKYCWGDFTIIHPYQKMLFTKNKLIRSCSTQNNYLLSTRYLYSQEMKIINEILLVLNDNYKEYFSNEFIFSWYKYILENHQVETFLSNIWNFMLKINNKQKKILLNNFCPFCSSTHNFFSYSWKQNQFVCHKCQTSEQIIHPEIVKLYQNFYNGIDIQVKELTNSKMAFIIQYVLKLFDSSYGSKCYEIFICSLSFCNLKIYYDTNFQV